MPAPFFPVARKEYLTRRHAASGATYDQNPTPLNPNPLIWRPSRGASDPAIAPINPPPYYSAGVRIALRGGIATVINSLLLAMRRRPFRFGSAFVKVATVDVA